MYKELKKSGQLPTRAELDFIYHAQWKILAETDLE
jgi:hypothetical protein